MAPHSSTHAWKIPWAEEPGRLQSMGSLRVGHFDFSLSCTGEGNGNPFQCSCLENPRDRGAWWAAVYGVAQSWTRLKQLSSSSSRLVITFLPRSKRLLISWLQSPSAVILEPKKIKSDTVSTVSPSISHEVMGPDAMILQVTEAQRALGRGGALCSIMGSDRPAGAQDRASHRTLRGRHGAAVRGQPTHIWGRTSASACCEGAHVLTASAGGRPGFLNT